MKKLITLFVVGILIFNIACSGGTNDANVPSSPPLAVSIAPTESIPSQSTFESTYGSFGPHFNSWLSSHGYSFSDGGFGGFRSNVAPVTSKKVVVFIHGNGSRAQGSSGDPKGWYNTYQYLRQQGWNNSELYAVNYGYEGALYSAYNDHRSSFVNVVKNFINAVYAYTGKKVTVVAHSLGCTLTRKAMKDGNLYSKIDTYVAIAGAHHGLPTCGYQYGWYYFQSAYTPTCSSSTGFLYPPNYMTWLVPSTSYFIGKLNDSYYGDDEMQGKTTRTYVIMSTVDEIAGVRASYTSKLAGAYKTKVYSSVPYGHFNAKDLTASVQKQMIERTY
jgi:predicted alpha/beta hydrolase family esterase